MGYLQRDLIIALNTACLLNNVSGYNKKWYPFIYVLVSVSGPMNFDVRPPEIELSKNKSVIEEICGM